ncbi:MAG: hypothetical protein LBP19_05420 [Treponema sp.]|nr:hypothetical protein [Treponema sp.]
MLITYFTASNYQQECRDFLAWLASREGATIAARKLPLGYFPMINFSMQMDDPHVNEFLSYGHLNVSDSTDVRFVWPRFLELYEPMNRAVIQVINGETTPQQAADSMETAAAALRAKF